MFQIWHHCRPPICWNSIIIIFILMRSICIVLLIVSGVLPAFAQYASPSTTWTGYRMRSGDTLHLDRHIALHTNDILDGKPVPQFNEWDEHHLLSVDSVDADGNIYLIDDIRSNSIIRTYTSGGTVNEQTGQTKGWHRTLVIAKVSKTGKFLGGNEYWMQDIDKLGDSVSMPEFRRKVRSEPTRGRVTLGYVLPVLGSAGLRQIGSKWKDTILYDAKIVRFETGLAASGSKPLTPVIMWGKDTVVYYYEVIGQETHNGLRCLKVKSTTESVQSGAQYHLRQESTIWLDDRTGLPVDQEKASQGWSERFENAGGMEKSSVVLEK